MLHDVFFRSMTTTLPTGLLAFLSAKPHMLPWLFRFGLLGLGLVSVVDSSFIPLPIPGVTDILVVLYAAGHMNPILLIVISTLGSAVGGFLSHAVGQTGGMAFLEKKVPPKLLKRVTRWVEDHSIISIALPAILPPPAPLSPFVLVAGAVRMSRRKFMIAFTGSRLARHAIACWLGIHYGASVLKIWNRFSDRWAITILIVFWSVMLIFLAIAIWKLIQTSRSLGLSSGNEGRPSQPKPATSA